MTNAKSEINGTILVLGGTGKTGSRLVERLQKAGRPVRVGSRSAEIPFDWNNRATWDRVLEGIGAVYVAYHPDIAVPGAIDDIQPLFSAALDHGIERIVLLSGRGEPEAQEIEETLITTGADWTILRASWFAQNFSEGFFFDPILAGEVVLPAGPVPEPFIDVEDIADMAFAALTEEGHSRQLYEITGPRGLTFADAIGEIALATGRDVRFIEVAPEDYRAELERLEVPKVYIDLVLYLFTTVLDGRNVDVMDGIERVLGRKPRDFSDYVRRTAATGIWGGLNA